MNRIASILVVTSEQCIPCSGFKMGNDEVLGLCIVTKKWVAVRKSNDRAELKDFYSRMTEELKKHSDRVNEWCK